MGIAVADVRAFRGIHYNPTLLQDWSRVICPVYDIIPPGQNEQLYSRSPFNFVRLEAGRELPQDTPTDNKYTRAAATLDEWLHDGILETDHTPAIYLHHHVFTFAGQQYTRRALIARVHLEEWDRMIVRPHESTFADARSDRLSLLWAIQANTSSILSLFQDEEGTVRTVLARAEKAAPAFDLKMAAGEGHRVWALSPDVTGQISSALAAVPLYIADGHHRYESALAYSRQRRSTSQLPDGQPYDFVMMTLVPFDDPGLLILPPHRLIRGITRSVFDGLRPKLAAVFKIDEWDSTSPGSWERLDTLRKPQDKPRLALFGLNKKSLLVLEPKDLESLAPMMPQFHSDLYRRLEVSIIDHVILEKLLGLSHEKDKVGYTYIRQDAMERVQSGEFQLAFILEPIRPETIKGIADLGDKMPKKSTYFYPKVPAGLIMNRLV